MNREIELNLGYRTALVDGCLIPDSPEHISSGLCYANAGDCVYFDTSNYVFAIGTYNLERDLSFKEDFKYLKEGAWIQYNQDLNPCDYSRIKYMFRNDCYYKICIKRADGKIMNLDDIEILRRTIVNIPEFHLKRPKESFNSKVFGEEVSSVVRRYNEIVRNKADCLSFVLLSDSHNVLNGTWSDTENNIKEVLKYIEVDGIIHLGDLIDGVLSKNKSLWLANETIKGLKTTNYPVYLTLGNHDSNYYMNNPDYMAFGEQAENYLGMDKPYYYIDSAGIRLIFLFSYDNDNPIRYGFLDEEIEWLDKLLLDTPESMRVMVFSHEAPLKELDYWAKEIYNGDRLMDILEKQQDGLNTRIIGFFHGHNHVDLMSRKFSFPIVSIGCNKCEDFQKFMPEGGIKHMRQFDHVSQDLWDIMIYNKRNGRLNFVRFGAGEDREVK